MTSLETGPRQASSTRRLGQYLGLVVGLWVTAASMSSGFIWASQGKVALVYVAGFFSWTGYIFAHYAAIGVFVDDVTSDESTADDETVSSEPDDGGADGALGRLREIAPSHPVRAVGFVAGIVVLVAGIAVLAWYVRLENHLMGNVGSGMFLGGYVLAHYFDSGKLL